MQAAQLLGELRSAWGMRPPAAVDDSGAALQHVYTSSASVH